MQKGNILKTSIRHVQLLRFFLLTIGAWPTELFEGKSRRKFILALVIPTFVILLPGQTFYLVKNIFLLSFFDLVDIFLTMFLSFLTLGIGILPVLQSYGLLVKHFVTDYNLNNFKNRGGHYEKVTKKINTISYCFSILIMACSILAWLFFNFVPLYNNYMNGVFGTNTTENQTIQYAVYYLYPWYKEEDHFITSTLINCIVTYSTAILVCGSDLMMTLMVFQIIGHLKTLKYDIRELPKPKQSTPFDIFHHKTNTQFNLFVELYDAQENIIITEKIVDIVKHHRLIVSFAEGVADVFGPLLAFIYLFDLFSCAFLLLVCSDGQLAAIARFGPIALITFSQLVQISVMFEIIGSESEKLRDELYYAPWECMSVSNQKMMWILLNRTQYPIRVIALGMVEVGVQAMASILKTTFSYLTLLRSIGE